MKLINCSFRAGLIATALSWVFFSVSVPAIGQKKRIEPTKDEVAQMLKSIPTKDGKITYDEVIVCDSSVKKNQLFLKIRQWFVENFTESKAVLEVNDIENGLLTGKGTYKYSNLNGLNVHTGYTHFLINVAVKDGKFRYQLYDFSAENKNQSMFTSAETSYKQTINLDDMLIMYKEGKREKYARKFLEDMVELVYFINHSLTNLKTSTSIQDF